MRKQIFRKNSALGIAILIITTLVIPVVNAHFRRANIVKETQKSVQSVGSKKQKAMVYVQKYTLKTDGGADSCLKSMSLEKAEQLKKRLLSIEENYSGVDKIKEQLRILKKIEVVSSHLTIDKLLVPLLKMGAFYNSQLFTNNGILFGGPMLVSHFIPGGYISGVAPLGKWYYNVSMSKIDWLFNGSLTSRTIAALPLFLGVSFATTYITAIDFKLKSHSRIFCPFVEILMPAIGTGIRVIVWANTNYTTALFEYNIDLCLIGFLGGISVIKP